LIVNGTSLTDPAQTFSVDGTAVAAGEAPRPVRQRRRRRAEGWSERRHHLRQPQPRHDDRRRRQRRLSLCLGPGFHDGGPGRYRDFNLGDILDLSAVDANSNAAGDQAFTYIGVIEAEVDGELVALHVDKGTCYGFNGTATRIWALIETPLTAGRAARPAGRGI
jgi:hypothetical protein